MNIAERLFLSLIAMAACSALPTNQRFHHHRSRQHSKPTKWQRINTQTSHAADDETPSPNSHTPENFKSVYVTFSPDKPESPPWMEPGHRRRQKRSVNITDSSPHIKTPVCESLGHWVEKQTAEDMFSNTVRVVQKIDIGGTRMNQYFYETYCRQENCQCRGIDTENYTSQCESKTIWVYAKIIDAFDTVGWNYIKLRAACGCSVTEKEREQSIWGDVFR